MKGIVYFNPKINNGIEGTIKLIQFRNHTHFQINLIWDETEYYTCYSYT